MSVPQQIVDKVSSGRFWMAMSVAAVFMWAAMNKYLDAKDVQMVIVMVFSYYFGKSDNPVQKV